MVNDSVPGVRMMAEFYNQWIPSPRLPGDVYIQSILDDLNGLTIKMVGASLSKENLSIVFFFEAPLGYRNFNESERLELWRRMPVEIRRNWCFFTIDESLWIRWIKKESGGTLDDKDIAHYAIFTEDDCFEILSLSPPEVSVHGDS